MAKKINLEKNENVQQVENTQVENTQVENTQVENTQAQALKDEANRLAQEAAAAKAAAKAAAAAAKAAKAAAKAFTSRPVRKSYFEVRVYDNVQAMSTSEGEYLGKSDVHYCAEKMAIDALASLREQYGYDEHVYSITVVNKETQVSSPVSFVYLDATTSQIVID